ncbi:group II intron reverse transcriptase/maturase [Bacillus sp. (in: firmicutes)]|uniref:group II intron reverse transcriptase/maturase n=1 Tax=Bacillus sp. TaxID=1409 RepID=UPI0023F034FE|nr:group II intron reverse transcriptase/maturase [Bacillus sp. (in: firmicutes)]
MNKSKAQLPELMREWNTCPWRKLERKVFKLQKRIFRASGRGDVKAVRRLQKTLMKSRSARCLAVRKVTQDNQGKKTAGIDGKKSLSPKQRLELASILKISSKAQPTRRVWIPKPGKKEKRPLGIPTIYDRALQTLVKLALEPEWEANFEPNSYGFRPGRSCHDAIAAIFSAICKKPKYVLDTDIAKCFDRINHQALLDKINTYPTLRRQIKAWLKSGVIDNNLFVKTTEGTPQGGTISPLLANIALHGMEERIRVAIPQKSQPFRRKKPNLIRYADDLVILHAELEVIQKCQQVLREWLTDMGLELKPSKTRITHTLNQLGDEQPGLDFLGFTIRQFPVGKCHSGKDHLGNQLGFKTIIKPSKESVNRHYRQVSEMISAYKNAPQVGLISKLNPLIRGWSNYYSAVVSKEVFSRLDHLITQRLITWGRSRHPNKGIHWVVRKYWKTNGNNTWSFATTQKGLHSTIELVQYKETPIIRHIKVKGNASPYDGNLVYWSTRMGKHPEMPKTTATLLKRQLGKCQLCGLMLRDGDKLNIDHIIPLSQGGKYTSNNLQLLHKHCHDTKTARDRGMYDKHQSIEERLEVKVSRAVLQTSREGDFSA